ncbi:MAG: hypothetical protein ACI4L8_07240 [Candidatus Fimadaptatus sp.]
MEFIVVIIVIAVVLSNLKKQGKTQGRGAKPAQPYAPSQPAQPMQPAQSAQPARPAWPQSAAPARLPRKPFAAASAPEDAPRDVDSAPQGLSRGGSLAGEDTLMSAEAQPCAEGDGSIAHTSHEGEEFHAPGAHGRQTAAGPGGLAARPVLASRLDDSLIAAPEPEVAPDTGEEPELMGLKLDADAMRRAVVFSEIINKRGGRHGWVRT